jgi:mRNA interferase RelE/StbE
MTRYEIEFVPLARRQLKKLEPKARIEVQKVIDGLADDPRPNGYKKLHGKLKAFHRVESGNFRVIYAIRDEVLIVLIVKVGDRRDIYS